MLNTTRTPLARHARRLACGLLIGAALLAGCDIVDSGQVPTATSDPAQTTPLSIPTTGAIPAEDYPLPDGAYPIPDAYPTPNQ